MWGYHNLYGYSRGSSGGSAPPEVDTFEETIEMSVGLDDLDWVEIITLDEDYSEDMSMSVGLDDITWEEDTEGD